MSANVQTLRERAALARSLASAEQELRDAEQRLAAEQEHADLLQVASAARSDLSIIAAHYRDALTRSNLALSDLVNAFAAFVADRRQVASLADQAFELARSVVYPDLYSVPGIDQHSAAAELSDALTGLAQQELADRGLRPALVYDGPQSREFRVLQNAVNQFGGLVLTRVDPTML